MHRLLVAASLTAACGKSAPPPPELTVVGESTRLRLEAPRPEKTAWFDGQRVSLVAARGETLGLQIVSRVPAATTLTIANVDVDAFEVDSFIVRRPSTRMYGGSLGAGSYPDALHAATGAVATNPAYFEVRVASDLAPGTYAGELVVGARHVPVSLEVVGVTLPRLPIGVWAYGDPRELAWADNPTGDPPRAEPSPRELACIAMFRAHGVLLSPNIHPEWWSARKALFSDVRDVPVWIPSEPTAAADAVRFWIAEFAGTGQVPFAIPIDEPATMDKQKQVYELATAVRAAGGGASTFRYAVTDDIHPDRYGTLIDLYISLYAKRTDHDPRWSYNGAPPHAGSMLLDTTSPGTRTWGWIAWRWHVPTWYVWDALYWHDRHNRRGAPLPGKPLVTAVDPVSFDDGTDHGNFDGVLALPAPGGCTRTLRLAAMRRGQQDRQLLEIAAICDRDATEKLAARMVPRALGDAPKGSARSWSADESDWERARRELLTIAASCSTRAAAR